MSEPQKDLVTEARELVRTPMEAHQFARKSRELLRQLADEVERRDELIVHMHVHSGYRNNGYMQMTTPQKVLYDDIWERSVKALNEEEAKAGHDNSY